MNARDVSQSGEALAVALYDNSPHDITHTNGLHYHVRQSETPPIDYSSNPSEDPHGIMLN